ncbi:hypothetical protein IscW_ISCW003051 [Ixodes scapularis]|uniref:Chitinase n=1 Tax=Ixodes scapularis TaxID=6945 RepID=B7PCB2_IXOSC|nr:hypothetical protein IscW_ISCW003051 [Ixodes scapularis]|eukprot:XP_002409567.1 hypothetical protein IscW_ISCW003051 [Ixodes scapularis]
MIYATLLGFAVILILLGIIAYFAGMTPSPKPGKKPQLIICYYDPTLSSLSSFVLSDFCAQCCSHIVFDGFELDATKHIVSRQAPPPHPGVKLPNAIADWVPTVRASGLRLLIGLRSEHFGDLAQDDVRFREVLEEVRTRFGVVTGVSIYWENEATLDLAKQRTFYAEFYNKFKPTTFELFVRITSKGVENQQYDINFLVA